MGSAGWRDSVWPMDGVTRPLPVPPAVAAPLHVMSGLWSGCGGARCMWPDLCDPQEPGSALRPCGWEAGALVGVGIRVAGWWPRRKRAKADMDSARHSGTPRWRRSGRWRWGRGGTCRDRARPVILVDQPASAGCEGEEPGQHGHTRGCPSSASVRAAGAHRPPGEGLGAVPEPSSAQFSPAQPAGAGGAEGPPVRTLQPRACCRLSGSLRALPGSFTGSCETVADEPMARPREGHHQGER